MVEEAQADCGGYSLDYVEVEKIWELSKYDAETAKTDKNIYLRLQMDNTKGN